MYLHFHNRDVVYTLINGSIFSAAMLTPASNVVCLLDVDHVSQ